MMGMDVAGDGACIAPNNLLRAETRLCLGSAVRRAKVEALEGRHDGRRMVIFEFPSMEAIHHFWDSPDYVPVKKIREGAAALDVWAVEGVR